MTFNRNKLRFALLMSWRNLGGGQESSRFLSLRLR